MHTTSLKELSDFIKDVDEGFKQPVNEGDYDALIKVSTLLSSGIYTLYARRLNNLSVKISWILINFINQILKLITQNNSYIGDRSHNVGERASTSHRFDVWTLERIH